MIDNTRMDVDYVKEADNAAAAPPQPEAFGAGPTAAAPQQEQQDIIDNLEVDLIRADDDSALGSDVSSITTSMRTADIEFRYEHGRRYQASNAMYHLPNDIQEMDRLELQHLIWLELTGGRLYLAPLDQISVTHALDLGTGTGNWAIEFASQHPQVKVLGTDLSPIQPEYVPANCDFVIDDATQEWSFHERFDYIHSRALSMGIADWDKFVDQAYNYLQPGGFLELQGSALWTWGRKVQAVCGTLGIDAAAAQKHGDRLRQRGFQEVNAQCLPCPLGPWAKGQRQKRLGWMARKDLYEGIDAISKKLFLMAGDSEEEVDAFLARCKEELLDPTIHACMPLDIIWGQRPFNQ
ncbi:hypothetical protein DL764_007884 [Monosporascus ibericus]|uniref:Methyltransferase domain-containing protein n=1 Tax=Monosporascus ibericus TaxID=155417 RepID=A0A4Q4SYY3_9PEZI|nr:hypothetical protein DL764_007884 [Monosporascus ibericus]